MRPLMEFKLVDVLYGFVNELCLSVDVFRLLETMIGI